MGPTLLTPVSMARQATLKFGKFANGNNVQGVYLDPEPVSHGGLGKIGQELPVVFKEELGIPLMKLAPLLNPMKGELKTAKKLAQFTVPDWKGRPAPVDVYELAAENGVRRIVLANDDHFGQFDNLTSDTNVYQSKKAASQAAAKALGDDPGLKAYIFFSKAAAELLNKHQSALGRQVNFVVANDWMTAATLNELTPDVAQKMKKLYFFHNHYDEPRRKAFFEKLGLKMPEKFKDLFRVSLSALGLLNADHIIINRHYRDSLLNTDLAQGHPMIPSLQEQAARTVDMHHGILETDNPRFVSTIKKDGYTGLNEPVSPEEMKRFKAENKSALQKELGLNQNPNAVVFSFVSRFDPRQKGFGLVADTVRDFLKQNPDAQVVLCGLDPTPSIEADLNKLSKSSDVAGRFYYSTKRANRHRVMAGSDFFLMPSLYEPFGLGQLESMKMGTIPIVLDVDGLKSTTSDPERNTGDKETAWNYGQVAVKAKSFNIPAYRRAFEKQENPPELSEVEEKVMQITDKMGSESPSGNGFAKELLSLREDIVREKVWTQRDQTALDSARSTFRESLDRAMTLAKDEKKMNEARVNAIKYVDKEHTWGAIAKRYYEPLMLSLFPSLKTEAASEKQAEKPASKAVKA